MKSARILNEILPSSREIFISDFPTGRLNIFAARSFRGLEIFTYLFFFFFLLKQ